MYINLCHLPFMSYGSLHPASIHILRPAAALLKFGPELGLVNAMPQGAKTMHVLTQLDPTSWIEEVSLPLTWCVVWSCFINPYVLYFLVSFLWVAHMLRSQVSGIHEIVPSCPCSTVQANKSTQLVKKYQTCVRKKKHHHESTGSLQDGQLHNPKKIIAWETSLSALPSYSHIGPVPLFILLKENFRKAPLEDHLCIIAGYH